MNCLRIATSAFRIGNHFTTSVRSSCFFSCLNLNLHKSSSVLLSYRNFTACKRRPVFIKYKTEVRFIQTREEILRKRTILMYVTSVVLVVIALSYAAVPMYRIYCQSTSYGGEVKIADASSTEQIQKMTKVKHRPIAINFNADTSSGMQWKFRPHQSQIVVHPGETALAFYTATNPTDLPIIGISTYNVIPFEAGQYFNKIQCFCFEEQRLNPREQVDMPVFFYIDPEFAEDPKMEFVDEILLSYTFFEAKEGMKLPVPRYAH